MKVRFRMTLFCVLILTFLFCGAAYAMELNMNVHTGEKYSLHEFEQHNFVYTINNREIEKKNFLDINLYMEILGVDKDKNATIQYRFDSIKIMENISRKTIDYDSTQGSLSGLFCDIFNGFIGKSFTAKVDKKGHVLDVQGVDEILNSLLNSLPGYEQNKEETKKIIVKILGDDTLKRILKMEYYPDKNINVGDAWESKDVEVMKPAVVIKKRTFIGEQDGILHIEISNTLDRIPSDYSNNSKILKLNVSGKVDISKNNGLVQSGYEDGNIEGEIETTNPQGEKVIVPLRIYGRSTCEITKQ
jgi:hypothetical protein